MIAEPVARWAAARAQAIAAGSGSGRVFRYRFDHPGAGPELRATHTAEVPLLFGSWRDGGPGERLGGQSPGAGAVAAELVSAWAGVHPSRRSRVAAGRVRGRGRARLRQRRGCAAVRPRGLNRDTTCVQHE